MLDAYIIEKIKRDQERDKLQRQPARIERPQEPRQPHRGSHEEEVEPERGVVIIDF